MGLQNDSFQTSNTYQNILAAFTSEAFDSTRYMIFGDKARDEGYEQIGDVFEQTSKIEKAHAEVFKKLLHEGEIPSTLDNLKDAFTYENKEWTSIYINYSEEAKREGYPEIARLFEAIAAVERFHDSRYRKLYQNILYDAEFCKPNSYLWECRNCGNQFYGECAPDLCPLCGYHQGYYQINCEIY